MNEYERTVQLALNAAEERRAAGLARPRLGHCTPTFGGHSPACGRNGRYCSQTPSHIGDCTPHGVAK